MSRFNYSDKKEIASYCEQLASECDKLASRIEFQYTFTAQAIYSAASCLYDAAAMQKAKDNCLTDN